ncbi:beta-galactosidase [Naasia sp. SYSU D00948]|uniref:beta-galactosidase n=1 Tax=Naasia sp. SYSU D00948 TaxID=2817379 RepID=UPI001FEF39E6|nr:beta-galactosidase [Naasia sp. SYSU D00948]
MVTGNPRFSGVLFGAAYYAEYQPSGTLERDLDLMRDAGFTVIRVGESVWSTWEPREGEFHLDWLQPVLDGAHERGIGVILGTPTYAVPPWLQRLHPEIAAETASGNRIGWGARQEMDQSHPAYRFYAERIARKVVERYADHPAVIGYQVDNEPGNVLPHNEATFQRFVDWLRRRYGSVERLNEEWGLVYWSHRLSDWSELWRPHGNSLPQYQLEWRRFQGTLATDLMAWQADLVRQYAREDQFITTCISYSRPQVSDDELVGPLDVVAGNPYYKMQDGLTAGVDVPREKPWWHTGVWALFQWGDRAWSSAQAQYLVTETDAQSIGGPWQNHPPYPGQLKQAAFALLARGGRMVEYWHWHTLHFGTETYWGGVLPHSQRPGRIYREVTELGAALKAIGPALDDYEPDADALLLYSTDTKWSFEFHPPLALPNGDPDPGAYLKIFESFYRGLFEAGAQLRVQHLRQFLQADPEELARRFPVLVAPAAYVAEDAVLEALVRYAEAGGHLVVGIRTGYGDELARARLAVAPHILAEPAGVHYDEYSNLSEPLPVTATSAVLDLEPGAAGTDWVDVLEVDDADVLLEYAPTELGARAALTTRAHGRGRVSYLGTVPDPALARSVGRWLVPDTVHAHWQAPASVTVSTGRTGRGRVAFVANWSAEPAAVVAPAPLLDLVSGDRHGAGATVTLEPRAALAFEIPEDSPESPVPSTERTR